MLKMPLGEVIERIKTHSGLSEEDVRQKIKDKTSALSGLISDEGAAYIIANELGIKLLESTGGLVKIKNILAGMRNVDTAGKVQRKYELREFDKGDKKGKVASLIIADETSSIRLVLWNEMADKINSITEDMILKIEGAYVRENNGRKEVHLGERGSLELNPDDVKIGPVRKFGEAVRKRVTDLNEDDSNVELFGAVIDVREPRFYEVCPTCNKRMKMGEGGFVCETHGSVDVDFGYVMNLMVDDGSDSIPVVFFRNQADRLLGKSKDEMLHLKDNKEDFPAIRSELIGRFIKTVGRVTRNTMFDRLEFVSQLVFTDINPEEEMAKLNIEVKKAEDALKDAEEEVVEFDDDKKVESIPAESVVDSPDEESVSDDTEKIEIKTLDESPANKDDSEDEFKSVDDLDPILS